MVQPLWKTAWQFLQMLNIQLVYNLAIPFYPRKIWTCHIKTRTQYFTAALFIITKKWKQPKCLPTDEPINIYNGMSFSYRKEWRIDVGYNIDKLWKHYVNWKKPITKSHILYETIIWCTQDRKIHID